MTMRRRQGLLLLSTFCLLLEAGGAATPQLRQRQDSNRRLNTALDLPLRINIGGSSDAQLGDVLFEADSGAFDTYLTTDGTTGPEPSYDYVTPPADGTSGVEPLIPPAIYESMRALLTGSQFTYAFPLPTSDKVAKFRVRIHFVEPDTFNATDDSRSIGARVDGKRRIFDLDVHKRAGKWAAYVWEDDEVLNANDDGSKTLSIQILDRSVAAPAGVIVLPSAIAAVEVLPCDFPKWLKTGGVASGYDDNENHYMVDFASTTSAIWSESARTITGASATDIYQSGREGTTMKYIIPVPRQYEKALLRLHFREHDNTVSAAGQRVFDVVVNGEVVLYKLDLFDLVGLDVAYRWLGFVETTIDYGGHVVVELHGHGTDKATICAIQLLSSGESIDSELIMRRGPPVPVAIPKEDAIVLTLEGSKYNMGDQQDDVLNPGYIPDWVSPDTLMVGSDTGVDYPVTYIANTIKGAESYDPKIYNSYREGSNLEYSIPVGTSPAIYFLVFHFSEQGVTSRFDVVVEGKVEKYNLDVLEEAGETDKAFRVKVYSEVADGSIDIELYGRDGHNATVNGLEVYLVTSAPTGAPTPKPTYGPCIELYHRRDQVDGACHYDAQMCHYNTDCTYPSTNWCDLDTNRCKVLRGREDPPYCTGTNADECPSSQYVCQGGRCRWGCATDDDCEHAPLTALGEAPTCYESTYCAQSCTEDTDCALPLGKCDDDLGTCVAIITACTTDSDCVSATEMCDNNVCVAVTGQE